MAVNCHVTVGNELVAGSITTVPMPPPPPGLPNRVSVERLIHPVRPR